MSIVLVAAFGFLTLASDQESEVDLLKRIDPLRDAVHGTWKLDKGVLETSATPNGRLQVPYDLPVEYDLTVVAELRGDSESLNLGLSAEGRQFLVVLNGWGGTVSGLQLVNGRGANANETSVRGPVFTKNKPSAIVCSVRRNCVTVTVDGRKVIDWATNYSQVQLDESWKCPKSDQPILGSYSTSFLISKVSLKTVTPRPDAPNAADPPAEKRTVAEWTARLSHAEAAAREQAAERLGAMGEEAASAAPPLLKAIMEGPPQLRRKAADALAKMGPAAVAVVPSLVNLLGDADPDKRRAAIRALTTMKPGANAVAPLMAIVRGDFMADPIAREFLLNPFKFIDADGKGMRGMESSVALAIEPSIVLAAAGAPAVSSLTALLKEKEVELRFFALLTLQKMGPAGKVTRGPLLAALKDPHPQVRLAAFGALEAVSPGDPALAAAAAQLAADKDPQVRKWMAEFHKARESEATIKKMKSGGKESLPAVLTGLKSPDANVRLEAAQALRAMGAEAKPAVPALVAMLGDPERTVEAAQVLTSLGPIAKEAAPALFRVVKERPVAQRDARLAAAEALPAVGADPKEMVPVLIGALDTTDRPFRKALGMILSRVGAVGAPALAAALKDSRVDVRKGALQAMALGADGPVPDLLPLLNDPDPETRLLAVMAVGRQGLRGRPAAPALLDLLGDRAQVREFDQPPIPRAAMGALLAVGRLGEDAAPALLRALRDPLTRSYTSTLLVKVDPSNDLREATPFLLELSSDPVIGTAVLRLMVRMDPKSALEKLIEALRGPNAVARDLAFQTISRLGPDAREAIPALAQLLEDPARIESVCLVLERMGSDASAARPALEKLMRGANPHHATRAMVVLGRAGASEPLLEELRGNHGRDRSGVPAGLRALGIPGVPAMLEALKDRDAAVRYAAAQAALGWPAISPELVAGLNDATRDADRRVGRMSISVLGFMGPEVKSTVPAVWKALESRDPADRRTAAQALARIGGPSDPGVAALLESADAVVRSTVEETFKAGMIRVPELADEQLPKVVRGDLPGLIQSLAAEGGPPSDTFFALRALGPQGVEAVPALIRALRHEVEALRPFAADTLGAIGADAREAIPELRRTLGEAGTTPLHAWAALKKIDR